MTRETASPLVEPADLKRRRVSLPGKDGSYRVSLTTTRRSQEWCTSKSINPCLTPPLRGRNGFDRVLEQDPALQGRSTGPKTRWV